MSAVIEQVFSDPDIYKIEVPFENLSTSATNCYVMKDGGDVLVVDTGAPTDEGAAVLSDALDKLEVDRDCATWFLTHLHMDHAGLVDQVVPQMCIRDRSSTWRKLETARIQSSNTM